MPPDSGEGSSASQAENWRSGPVFPSWLTWSNGLNFKYVSTTDVSLRQIDHWVILTVESCGGSTSLRGDCHPCIRPSLEQRLLGTANVQCLRWNAGGSLRTSAARVVRYRSRTTFARQWGAYLSLVLLIGLIGGIAMGSIAAARRTQSAYPAFLAATNASDLTMSTYGVTNNSSASNYSPRLTKRNRPSA